jgi:hypothetical protein
MGKSPYTAPFERLSAPAPESLVTSGKAVFGTFDKEIKNLNILDAVKPTAAPTWMNSKRLTAWEALEVDLKEGTLVVGLCNMGIIANIALVFYEKETKKAYYWADSLAPRKAHIAKNLFEGSLTHTECKKYSLRFINNFQSGKCLVSGKYSNKKFGSIAFSFDLVKASLPSVVSIPFGPNRPLYTEKLMFRANGTLTLNGKTFRSDSNTMGVIDDHKGYYPHRAHYDWLTAMGVDKAGQVLGFNLTRNQSIDQERYNENLIWQETKSSLLPPVVFRKEGVAIKDFVSATETPLVWTVEAEKGMGHLTFQIQAVYKMIVHAGFVSTDYFIAYGDLKGYLVDSKGEKISFDGMTGIGEDKTIVL